MYFDFNCEKCEHKEEYWLDSIKDTAPKCPKCGNKMKRVFTPISIRPNGLGIPMPNPAGKNRNR